MRLKFFSKAVLYYTLCLSTFVSSCENKITPGTDAMASRKIAARDYDTIQKMKSRLDELISEIGSAGADDSTFHELDQNLEAIKEKFMELVKEGKVSYKDDIKIIEKLQKFLRLLHDLKKRFEQDANNLSLYRQKNQVNKELLYSDLFTNFFNNFDAIDILGYIGILENIVNSMPDTYSDLRTSIENLKVEIEIIYLTKFIKPELEGLEAQINQNPKILKNKSEIIRYQLGNICVIFFRICPSYFTDFNYPQIGNELDIRRYKKILVILLGRLYKTDLENQRNPDSLRGNTDLPSVKSLLELAQGKKIDIRIKPFKLLK